MAMNDAKTPQKTEGQTGPLGFLRPRDTARAARARGPHRATARLRIILPVTAMILLLGLIVWPALNAKKILTKALKNVPDLVIKDLNYTGLDSKNQPYSIEAAKATRPSGEKNIYDLEQPQGEITLQEGAWVAAKALYGRLDQDTHHLWLGGDVQLFHDKGYQFTTDEVQADLNDRYAWGEKPVLIQGGFGEIRGSGFRLLDSGNVMVVNGPAKALLNLHGGDASDRPATKK
jgi:lipopolysaccharide export system protein LptC